MSSVVTSLPAIFASSSSRFFFTFLQAIFALDPTVVQAKGIDFCGQYCDAHGELSPLPPAGSRQPRKQFNKATTAGNSGFFTFAERKRKLAENFFPQILARLLFRIGRVWE